jgi:hypothetical protein
MIKQVFNACVKRRRLHRLNAQLHSSMQCPRDQLERGEDGHDREEMSGTGTPNLMSPVAYAEG